MRNGLTQRLRRRGSILVVVMVTVLFATFALLAFQERAMTDLLVDQREVLARRLRMEAYSALEVTLAVLKEFSDVSKGLRSPAEGWGDPLTFAGYTPGAGRRVEVSFEDESGRISLPRTDAPTLVRLFRSWEITEPDAEQLADALIGWTKSGHKYSTSVHPDYEQATVPYEEPGRSLRSWSELAAIVKVREKFFTEDGRPNELWQRLTTSVSLLDFPRPNINGARTDLLAAVGQFNAMQQENITDFLRGTGTYKLKGPGYFQDAAEASRIAVGPGGVTTGFGATISALRINVLVIEGKMNFRLSAVIAPQGGAKAITTPAASQRPKDAGKAAQKAQEVAPKAAPVTTTAAATRGVGNAAAGAAPKSLKYPFGLLEITEGGETIAR
jgi:general secretion pathway protein K